MWDQSVPTTGQATAFNGYVFVRGDDYVTAFVGNTGAQAWQKLASIIVPGTGDIGGVVKISDQFGACLNTTGVVYFNITDGTMTTRSFTGNGWTALSTTSGSVQNLGAMFDPVTKCFIAVAINSTTGTAIGVCINASDTSAATLEWEFPVATQLEALAIADGKAFFGSGSENSVYAVDMQTGLQVWKQAKAGNVGYSATFYDGVLYQSASSTQITAFDGATGAVLHNFDAPSAAVFAYGDAAKYGRVYSKAIQNPQSWVGCWDVKSFETQWRQPANYINSFVVGAVADGKFYVCSGDLARGSLYVGNNLPSSGYWLSAFNAFTGTIIWSKPTSTPVVAPIIAYGNLYIVDGTHVQCFSDLATAAQGGDQGWYMFHGYNDITGQTLPGVATGTYPKTITSPTWKYKADSPLTGSPVAVNGYVYFGSFNGTLYCLDANTGTLVWSKLFNTRYLSTPCIANGMLFTGADDGWAYGLNATTGEVMWKSDAGQVTDMPLQTTAWQVKSSPCYYDGRVLVPAMDGNLYCFNSTTGEFMWWNPDSTTANGNAGTPIVYKDLYNRTVIYLNAPTNLKRIDINGTLISNTAVTSLTARANHGTVSIWNDLLFITAGAGGSSSTAKLVIYNASGTSYSSQGSALATTIFSFSASTPMTATPAIVASQVCLINNRTTPTNFAQLGYAGNPYRVNQTTVTGNWTRTLTAVYLTAGEEAICMALITKGTDLGSAMGTSGDNKGIPLDEHWIVNATNPYFVRLWSAWTGHQVFASPAVALDVSNPTWSPIAYVGNAAFGFTAYNGSSGEVASTFSALGTIYSSAALYQNKVYMTAEDAYLYCFAGSAQGQTFINAAGSASTVKVSQPLTISGRLLTAQGYTSAVSLE